MKVRILPYYTVSEWETWEGKWELIDGVPFAMSPLPTPKHQIISTNICRFLAEELKNCDKCICINSIDWVVSEDTVLEPDNVIICSEDLEKDLFSKKRLDFPPRVIFEILSPSMKEKDRITKFEIYEKQGVDYYVIIDPDTKEVEIYKNSSKSYSLVEVLSGEGEYTFDLGHCKPKLNFSQIWR